MPRSEAKAGVDALGKLGFEVHILSGDHPAVVHSVGRALGIPDERCHGGKGPEDKLQRVQTAAADKDVVMVGDGVNDAAALAAATVGVAVHGGAETCLTAADVFLQRPGIGTLTALVQGARRTTRTIRNNINVFLQRPGIGTLTALVQGARRTTRTIRNNIIFSLVYNTCPDSRKATTAAALLTLLERHPVGAL